MQLTVSRPPHPIIMAMDVEDKEQEQNEKENTTIPVASNTTSSISNRHNYHQCVVRQEVNFRLPHSPVVGFLVTGGEGKRGKV